MKKPTIQQLQEENEKLKIVISNLRRQLASYQLKAKKRYRNEQDYLPYSDDERRNAE